VVKPYRFLTDATNEFEEQVRYLDEQSPGLGDRFIQDLEAAIRVVREHPESGALVSSNVRKWVLRVFPFNVYYVDSSSEVIIVAVAAHRRRPRYWRNRPRNMRD
jgi:plasmid stabilization system protein ParE